MSINLVSRGGTTGDSINIAAHDSSPDPDAKLNNTKHQSDCRYSHFCVVVVQIVIVVIIVPIIITAIHCNGDAIADDYNATKYSGDNSKAHKSTSLKENTTA